MNAPAISASAAEAGAGAPIGMTEETFLLFYSQTVRPLRGYLGRMLGDATLVDDVAQEAYMRFLRARPPADWTAEHRKNYLFRIAANLLRDEAARRKPGSLEECEIPGQAADNVSERRDIERFMAALKPRERELLWLAYVEQFSHQDIACIVGAKAQSVRPMLSRAREHMAEILRKGGFKP
jgi:RNA polymerase sigma-70 factor (ECF subfamily)